MAERSEQIVTPADASRPSWLAKSWGNLRVIDRRGSVPWARVEAGQRDAAFRRPTDLSRTLQGRLRAPADTGLRRSSRQRSQGLLEWFARNLPAVDLQVPSSNPCLKIEQGRAHVFRAQHLILTDSVPTQMRTAR